MLPDESQNGGARLPFSSHAFRAIGLFLCWLSQMKAKAEKTQKAERDANSKSSTGTNNKIENQMTNQITNLSIKCDDEDSREEDAEELTPDEAEALKQLLASDAASGEDGAGCRDQTDHGNSSGEGENTDASACGEQVEESSDETRNGESKKNPDRQHARLERQVQTLAQ